MSNIVNHLRSYGLNVVVENGAWHRGRPYKFTPRAIIVHHDASSISSGNKGALGIVTNGRTGLPGPLSQFLLARDGTVHFVAAGYSNHAGYGGPKAGIPANMGNTYAYGIEAANNGIGEKWPKEQLNAYYRLCAALLDYMGTSDVSRVIGHKEWTSRKIDPAGIDMNEFRKQVAAALKAGPSLKTVRLNKLKKGKFSKDALIVKRRLAKRGFMKRPKNGVFNRRFNKKTIEAYAEFQRSLGYKGKDADGQPGPTSLRKLGLIAK